MKILHYYWCQDNDQTKPGGGIQVYLKNLVDIQKNNNDVSVLSSGTEYSLDGKCRIKKISSKHGVKRYAIINSPIMAPAKVDYYNQRKNIADDTLLKVLRDFVMKNGEYDIIHFHSLEGLAVNCLKLKKDLKKTKMILTLHNYYPFCNQVNLWKYDKINCFFSTSLDCANCVTKLPNPRLVKCDYLFISLLRRIIGCRKAALVSKKIKSIYQSNFVNKNNKERIIKKQLRDNEVFREIYLKNVSYINKYVDQVICVSDRVKHIAIKKGIKPNKCITRYIGTLFAENQVSTPSAPIAKEIKIAYLGYMRHDKGFYFFMDALERISLSISQHLKVLIAAKIDDPSIVKRIENIKNKFSCVELVDGYNHSEMKELLRDVNLGVVPVLWEDNLPQISMEFKALGIPVLSSDIGGAHELTDSLNFVFKANDIADFINKLKYIVETPECLFEYYEAGLKLPTMQEHNDELMGIYLA